jgi:hypothetical protein
VFTKRITPFCVCATVCYTALLGKVRAITLKVIVVVGSLTDRT